MNIVTTLQPILRVATTTTTNLTLPDRETNMQINIQINKQYINMTPIQSSSLPLTYLTLPDIILLTGAESSIKVKPTNALSSEPKYASRTSGDTEGKER